jgi:hypothetical protein
MSDFEDVMRSVMESETKLTYNNATIDSEVKRLQEIGFIGLDNQDVLRISKDWLDNAWVELDELEAEIKDLKQEIITEHDKIISGV